MARIPKAQGGAALRLLKLMMKSANPATRQMAEKQLGRTAKVAPKPVVKTAPTSTPKPAAKAPVEKYTGPVIKKETWAEQQTKKATARPFRDAFSDARSDFTKASAKSKPYVKKSANIKNQIRKDYNRNDFKKGGKVSKKK